MSKPIAILWTFLSVFTLITFFFFFTILHHQQFLSQFQALDAKKEPLQKSTLTRKAKCTSYNVSQCKSVSRAFLLIMKVLNNACVDAASTCVHVHLSVVSCAFVSCTERQFRHIEIKHVCLKQWALNLRLTGQFPRQGLSPVLDYTRFWMEIVKPMTWPDLLRV